MTKFTKTKLITSPSISGLQDKVNEWSKDNIGKVEVLSKNFNSCQIKSGTQFVMHIEYKDLPMESKVTSKNY